MTDTSLSGSVTQADISTTAQLEPVERFCHLVDDRTGRGLCGASLTGRQRHGLQSCLVEGHDRCAVCEELDGLGVATTYE